MQVVQERSEPLPAHSPEPSRLNGTTKSSDPAFLLARWFGPDLVIRALTFSNGLPWAVESGEITTADDLRIWIEAVLGDGAGYHDALYLAAAFELATDSELSALNDLYLVYCDGAGRGAEVAEQGEVFKRILRTTSALDVGDLAYPVAVGHAAARLHLPLEMTLRFYLRGFCGRLITSATSQLGLSIHEKSRINGAVQMQIDAQAKLTLNLANKGLARSALQDLNDEVSTSAR